MVEDKGGAGLGSQRQAGKVSTGDDTCTQVIGKHDSPITHYTQVHVAYCQPWRRGGDEGIDGEFKIESAQIRRRR